MQAKHQIEANKNYYQINGHNLSSSLQASSNSKAQSSVRERSNSPGIRTEHSMKTNQELMQWPACSGAPTPENAELIVKPFHFLVGYQILQSYNYISFLNTIPQLE
jgi:hypothetical protein